MSLDLGTLAAGAAVLTVLGAFARWAWPRWRRFGQKVDAGLSAVIGNDEIRDPRNPGRIIQPARPGLGVWMATTDEALAVLSTAVKALAEQDVRFEVLEARVTALESGHQVERVVGKLESTAAWNAVEAIANQPGEPRIDPAAD